MSLLMTSFDRLFFFLKIQMLVQYSYVLILLFGTRLESMGPTYCWNELITLSTKYRDLTAHSQLALTVS